MGNYFPFGALITAILGHTEWLQSWATSLQRLDCGPLSLYNISGASQRPLSHPSAKTQNTNFYFVE